MYGEIFKVVRKEKGFTQKEIYAGIVSKTFYSDFEAGKYSIEVSKFECLLENLGISYKEFIYYKELYQPNKIKQLKAKIDKLYKQGKFKELYHIYKTNCSDENKEIRYLAVNAYLLVLITNTNFYKLSREPLREIIADLKNAKMWTLKEIKRAKLVLLSLSEKDQEEAEQIFLRIKKELKKYQTFDLKKYHIELADLFFNRIQSLLVTFNLSKARKVLDDYSANITQSDNLVLVIQLNFITCLVNLYLDYSKYEEELDQLLAQIKAFKVSEVNFYIIIVQIHKERAKNHYFRYIK